MTKPNAASGKANERKVNLIYGSITTVAPLCAGHNCATVILKASRTSDVSVSKSTSTLSRPSYLSFNQRQRMLADTGKNSGGDEVGGAYRGKECCRS